MWMMPQGVDPGSSDSERGCRGEQACVWGPEIRSPTVIFTGERSRVGRITAGKRYDRVDDNGLYERFK